MDEDVEYCSDCLWLGNNEIMDVGDEQIQYCPCCGGTNSTSSSYPEWEKLFIEKYKMGRFENIHIKNKKGVELWKEIMKSDDSIIQ